MNVKKIFFSLFFIYFFSASFAFASDSRFSPGVIASPRGGYIDSIFVTPDGNRLYFLHSVMAPLDFAMGTSTYPRASYLPNHVTAPGYEWSADLYYIEWNGSAWSTPVNLGTNINTRANECCVWLNDSETEIIFSREANIPAPRGNLIATRASRNDPWGPAVFLPGPYGSEGQSDALYRHDVIRGPVTGDLYMWEKDVRSIGNSQLLYGKKSGADWLAPASIVGTNSLTEEESQPWLSPDELTLLFNRRGSDGISSLWKAVRGSVSAAWGAPSLVPISGLADPNGYTIWGEPTLPSSADTLIGIRLNTAASGWRSEIFAAGGTPASGFSNVAILNDGNPPAPPLLVQNVSFSLSPDTNRSLSNQSLTLSILPSGSTNQTTPLESQTITASGPSQVSLSTTSRTPGSYDVRVKGPTTLSRKQTFTLASNSTFTFTQKLISGDLNNDNSINSLDWSLMNTDWFQTGKTSDLNGDNITNALDFTWLNRNWFMQGE